MAPFHVLISKVKESVPDLSFLNSHFDNFRDAFSYFGELCDRQCIDYEFKGETTTLAGGVGYKYLVRLVVDAEEENSYDAVFLCGC